MKAKNVLLAAALGLVTTLALPAFAQYDRDHDGDGYSGWRQDRDHDGDRDDGRQYRDRDDRQAYQRGLNDGMHDRRDGRSWNMRNNRYNERDDREAYSRGYAEGYRNGGYRSGRGGWGWGNNGWGWNGNGGYYSQAYNVGQQSGYQDGLRYGAHDRQYGIPYRPTRTQEYRDGDHYYRGSYGDKNQYREGYREAFLNAYRQGYYGR